MDFVAHRTWSKARLASNGLLMRAANFTGGDGVLSLEAHLATAYPTTVETSPGNHGRLELTPFSMMTPSHMRLPLQALMWTGGRSP